MACVADRVRQGDRTGGETLSPLLRIMRFPRLVFSKVCLDQVKKFMNELLDIGVMADPVTRYAAEQNFRA